MNINKRYDNTGGSPGASTDKVSPARNIAPVVKSSITMLVSNGIKGESSLLEWKL